MGNFQKSANFAPVMIHYFSATGNTKFIANLLSEALGEDLCAERCVLCFPVHGWRVPSIVVRMVEDMAKDIPAGERRKIYVVLTCGDDCGKTIDYLREVTDPLGFDIAGAFSITMPESYVGLPFMDVDTKEKEQEKIEMAREKVQHIAEVIREGREGVYEVHEGGAAYLKSKVVGGFFHHVLITDKTFRVDAEACIGCGRCVTECQVENMRLTAQKMPEWLHNGKCMTCLACYHICPKHAISFNWMTKKKGQYHR